MVTQSSANIKTAAAGKVLQGQGVGTANDFSTATYPSTAGTSTNVLTSDGTNWTSASPALTQLFFANNSTDISDVTGDGTSYTVIWNNLTYGQTGSGYNTGTGVFTAPSTGWYFFTYRVGLGGLSSSHTACNCDLVTTDSFGLVYRTLANPANMRDSGNNCTVHDAQIVYLQAAATIKVVVAVFSGSKTVDIIGPQSTVQFYSTFTGARFF